MTFNFKYLQLLDEPFILQLAQYLLQFVAKIIQILCNHVIEFNECMMTD